VFGNIVDCPTENDSLAVYNNALKVYEFYEKSPNYKKLSSKKLRTRQDVLNCFYSLQDAVDSFRALWQKREQVLNGGADMPGVLLPRGNKNIPVGDYYQYVDAYRFYQRELENGILNTNSPFPLYDTRINPLVINTYNNELGYDEFNGDYVNVALYIPVTIKPFRLLTDSEKVLRQKVLSGIIPNKVIPKDIKKNKPKPQIPPPNKRITSDTTLLPSANIDFDTIRLVKKDILTFGKVPSDALPMYLWDGNGGGWIIGWMIKRKFRKFLPEDEFYWALPKHIKAFLNDDAAVEKYLRLKFGDYYDGYYFGGQN
jgi:hypothetical protein